METRCNANEDALNREDRGEGRRGFYCFWGETDDADEVTVETQGPMRTI